MTTITVEVAEEKKSQYEVFFRTLAKEYSIEEMEDFLLGLHMSRNDETSEPIETLRKKYARPLS